MDYRTRYNEWKNNSYFDVATHEELLSLEGNEEEIKDRFYQDLKFGTAGLRGKLGAGTNRMNIYTVSKATEGFARAIDEDGDEAKAKGVALSYDVRNGSEEFCRVTAEVFAAHGIHVYLYKTIQPTPILSYTIRHLNTHAGVMITASHNPKDYNGYKAYGSEGSQILDDLANRILNHMNQIQDYSQIERLPFEDGLEQGLIEWVPEEVLTTYRQKVLDLAIHDEQLDKNISIVYSPLNGCGYPWIPQILEERGFNNVHIVEEQKDPDGNFTTVGYPNPEDPKAFEYSIRLGKEVNADILIASDPDSDRTALEVRDANGEYVFFNGNKIGALLVDYILREMKNTGKLPKNGAVIKSIVTGDLIKPICEEYGVTMYEVLTGFKNIAAPSNEWDKTHEKTFIFGFEESIGFNHGNFVRDKDAVSSAMLVAEMAAFYKKQGKTLIDALNDIYKKYGYYRENLISIVLEGLDGQALIGRIMDDFRANPIEKIDSMKLIRTVDYQNDETGLPKSNVMKYYYDDGSWYALRPSGTEPKIKLYMYSVADTNEESEEKLQLMEKACRGKMDQIK